MVGGAKEHVLDLLKKYAQPLSIYVGITLVLGITYIGQIPDSITYRVNTSLGRFVLFWVAIGIADTYSWIYALLMSLFAVLVIAVSPRNLSEGFQDNIQIVTQNKKWWSEKVLGENPLGIEDDKVRTSAIQDNTNSSNSTTSSK
jgi:hypothetical protein